MNRQGFAVQNEPAEWRTAEGVPRCPTATENSTARHNLKATALESRVSAFIDVCPKVFQAETVRGARL